MPALPLATALLGSLIEQHDTATNASPPVLATNNAAETFDVICAWPVSGQYGPGSRFLYYVLVAACVLGRGSAWLRSACLAAALLLPAVAALHGIVLAAVHVDGAVDMDVYGAFQLCAIGVLAGPVTVKLSQTYFNTPGRNLIFLWTTMILAGLLSLTVEFFRVSPVSCPSSEFFYGEDACGLTCSVDNGPSSPMRGGAQNNLYVIKAPRRLNLGTVTLLAAACCIPAILSLVSMWNKILELNWKQKFGDDGQSEDLNTKTPPTNDATQAKMVNLVNPRIRFYLSMVEIPVFGAAILAILIVGEMNFFDYRVAYMTEPIASVGQWAPMVGTGLAALGSLYSLLAADVDSPGDSPGPDDPGTHHCDCAHHRRPSNDNDSVKTPSDHQYEDVPVVESGGDESRHDGLGLSRLKTYKTHQSSHVAPPHRSSHPRQLSLPASSTFGVDASRQRHLAHNHHHHHHSLHRAATEGTTTTAPAATAAVNSGGRALVANAFVWFGDKIGTPAPGAYDDTGFLRGPAADFPTVPGEEERNPQLSKIKRSYDPPRDLEGNATPLHRQRSRAASFNGSVASGLGPLGGGGGGEEGLSPAAGSVVEDDDDEAAAAAAAGPSRVSVERSKVRRNTLEVPKQVYHSPVPRKNSSFSSAGEPSPLVVDDATGIVQDPSSPTIRVSSECDS